MTENKTKRDLDAGGLDRLRALRGTMQEAVEGCPLPRLGEKVVMEMLLEVFTI